jgi:hypothetical protein
MAATRMTEATMTPEVLARFRPEYPAAAVAYMCAESFSETGVIISCAAGPYSAVRVMSAIGAQLEEEPSPESIGVAWAKITDMRGAQTFASAQEEVAFVLEEAAARPRVSPSAA